MIDGFKMGFIGNDGKLIDIPKDIQEYIDTREEFWFDKMKDIDDKCGVLLDQLALTEKALELACEELWCMSVWQNTKEEVIQDYIQCFKTKAKEMIDGKS